MKDIMVPKFRMEYFFLLIQFFAESFVNFWSCEWKYDVTVCTCILHSRPAPIYDTTDLHQYMTADLHQYMTQQACTNTRKHACTSTWHSRTVKVYNATGLQKCMIQQTCTGLRNSSPATVYDRRPVPVYDRTGLHQYTKQHACNFTWSYYCTVRSEEIKSFRSV
jgi:hypothetical protein